MFVQGVGQHDVFQRGTFLGDFQFAVAIGTLEVQVQAIEQLLVGRFRETDLFRQQQGATGQQAGTQAAEQVQPLFRWDELQGEVERDHRSRFERSLKDVGFHHLNR